MQITEAILRDAYLVEGKSTYEIAQMLNTYPNKVRRALQKYGIVRRNKSQAQTQALKTGRHNHPTKGKTRPDSVKIKISESMAKAWKEMSESERQRRVDVARKQWQEMSLEDRETFKELANEAVRIAAKEGSKLEKYLLVELRKRNYSVTFHAENVISREQLQVDLLLPDLKVAIEIDGPSHFYPIWGEDNLARHLTADNAKTGLLIQSGYVMVRVKYLAKTLSKIHERKVLSEILKTLDSIKSHFPSEAERLIEIEVK